jgi:hypothetical protein
MVDGYQGEWLSYRNGSLEAEVANVICWSPWRKSWLIGANSVFHGQLFEDGGSGLIFLVAKLRKG